VTSFRYTEEPPDGTILADQRLTEILVRDDAFALALQAPDGERWTNFFGDTWNWDNAVADGIVTDSWQRLYRQSDVDALLAAERAKVAEEIAAAIEVNARQRQVDAYLEGGQDYPVGQLHAAAGIARKHREEPK